MNWDFIILFLVGWFVAALLCNTLYPYTWEKAIRKIQKHVIHRGDETPKYKYHLKKVWYGWVVEENLKIKEEYEKD